MIYVHCDTSAVFCLGVLCVAVSEWTICNLELTALWVVHQYQTYERSLCTLMELQARKRMYGVCCSSQYVLAPENAPHFLPLQLPRHSPPPAHL